MTRLFFGLFAFFIFLTGCTDNRIQTSFFTQGNCEACKPIIEEAVKKIRGVKEAEWIYESSVTVVVYDTSAVDFKKIQEAVSKVGFETAYFPADAEAKKTLPACCQEATAREIKPFIPLPPGHGIEQK
ncbi:MAG: heavy-metal-associated domain-containing protein [Bacteroidota bacterium]